MRAAILACLILAGCGVAGPPVRPQAAMPAVAPAATPAPGVSVSGDAWIGVRSDDL